MPTTFWFLLLPGFSMMGLMSAIEPLRVANRFHDELYNWRLLSLDGGPVEASNGMSLNVEGSLEHEGLVHCALVISGFEPLACFSQPLSAWLHWLSHEGVIIGGIDTGSFILAESKLIDKQRITLHWEAINAFQERYPNVRVTQELFEIDGQRITTAGGTSTIDMMLTLIARDHGEPMAVKVSEQFVLGRIRSRQDHQRMQVSYRYGVHNKKLNQVIGEMERRSENLLTSQQLADSVQITSRQLERLFRQHLNDTPANFYLNLRLDKARQLLRQSDMNVLEVALACGFESSSYFSRRYRKRFNTSPSQDRNEHS